MDERLRPPRQVNIFEVYRPMHENGVDVFEGEDFSAINRLLSQVRAASTSSQASAQSRQAVRRPNQ